MSKCPCIRHILTQLSIFMVRVKNKDFVALRTLRDIEAHTFKVNDIVLL